MDHLIIGLAGKAGSGKDTLHNILEQALAPIVFQRWSIGDRVRADLNELDGLVSNSVNLFSLKGVRKEKWRPLMAAYGNACRQETEGRYFINELDWRIRLHQRHTYPIISVITDIRFDQFEHDEVYWLKEELKGKLIYIDRYTTDLDGNQSAIPFVNDLERSQDENLRKKADMIINWPTVNDRETLLTYAEPLISRIKQDWLPL